MTPARTSSGQRPARCRDDRGAARERLHHREPERLLEVDEVQQCARPAEQPVALGRAHRTEERDRPAVDVRLHLLAEVPLVLHHPGHHQRHPGAGGHLDRGVRALVGVEPPEEEQVPAVSGADREGVDVDAVVDGRVVASAPGGGSRR